MKSRAFRYWRDPLCIVACAAYALNRFFLAPLTAHDSFLRTHFDDLLLIPAALPLVLWFQRLLALRTHDQPPGAGEITFHLLLWSLISEWIGPVFLHHGTADLLDVAAYSAGAFASYICWWMEISLAAKQVHP